MSIFQTSKASKMRPYHNKLLKVEVLLNVLYLLPLILLCNLYGHLTLLTLYGLLLLVSEYDTLLVSIVELRENLDAILKKHLHRVAENLLVLAKKLKLRADTRRSHHK